MDAFHQLFDIAPSMISVHFCLSWAISLAFSKVRFGSWSSFWTVPSQRSLRLTSWPCNFSGCLPREPASQAHLQGVWIGGLSIAIFFLLHKLYDGPKWIFRQIHLGKNSISVWNHGVKLIQPLSGALWIKSNTYWFLLCEKFSLNKPRIKSSSYAYTSFW